MRSGEHGESACLCVFTRAPVAGKVKTRLLSCMDAESACRLHQQLIDSCLTRTIRNDAWASRLWGTDRTDKFLMRMSEKYAIPLCAQQGHDLGTRMAHAVKTTLQDYQHVVLIGTDCPELDVAYIEAALQELQAGAECVLGPAEDGGYVMLALSKYDESLFYDVAWGTNQVLAITRERIRTLGWQCEEMPVLWDVDRPEDLERLKMMDDL
ncbi:TIGR04282 family arsenosugar biosynthesis glycosyltransferase [Sulfuriflexus sp.]|uniref:TIGR04282 family arsenosugar biosynthesis glycosyltransferase n=1 Tax=Sulfuriflexus sp. TaxID=2015443 RepID=UPI0028CFA51C|nr:TIGR04282 family arsenosugar biosynthesis glycosyltransferase [Sulfuriflexus sp.]MDT8405453.1 TIGR04282 family arsenosugar biosynthesis glycosyltransferase [Sulfuriflexus sp.]